MKEELNRRKDDNTLGKALKFLPLLIILGTMLMSHTSVYTKIEQIQETLKFVVPIVFENQKQVVLLRPVIDDVKEIKVDIKEMFKYLRAKK